MEMEATKIIKVEAKTISLYMKVRDTFCARLLDQDGIEIGEIEDDYVPGFFPGDHYGDYLILEIDVDTGHIKNWKTPTGKDLKEAFCKPECEE